MWCPVLRLLTDQDYIAFVNCLIVGVVAVWIWGLSINAAARILGLSLAGYGAVFCWIWKKVLPQKEKCCLCQEQLTNQSKLACGQLDSGCPCSYSSSVVEPEI